MNFKTVGSPRSRLMGSQVALGKSKHAEERCVFKFFFLGIGIACTVVVVVAIMFERIEHGSDVRMILLYTVFRCDPLFRSKTS